jgi:hypothetical protein
MKTLGPREGRVERCCVTTSRELIAETEIYRCYKWHMRIANAPSQPLGGTNFLHKNIQTRPFSTPTDPSTQTHSLAPLSLLTLAQQEPILICRIHPHNSLISLQYGNGLVRKISLVWDKYDLPFNSVSRENYWRMYPFHCMVLLEIKCPELI